MNKNFKKILIVSALILTISACSLFTKSFSKKEIGTYLNPDIQSLTLLKSTEATKDLDFFFGNYIASYFNLKDKTFESIKNDATTYFYNKLNLNNYTKIDLSSDFEKNFYVITPKDAAFDVAKFIELGKNIDQNNPDIAKLSEIGNIVNVSLAYELRQNVTFSKFFKDLINGIKKEKNLTLTQEVYNDFTIYNVKGEISNYLLNPETYKGEVNIVNLTTNLKKILNNISFVYTGDYVFIAFNTNSLKSVLKAKDVDNSVLVSRLKDFNKTDKVLYSYGNLQSFFDWYLSFLKSSGALAKLDPVAELLLLGLGQSDVKKLYSYTLENAEIKDNKFLLTKTIYKNKTILSQNKTLEKVPGSKVSNIRTNNIDNSLFSIEMQDVNTQLDYLKSLILLSKAATEDKIEQGIILLGEQIPLFNVLKEDLKVDSGLNTKVFVTYNKDFFKEIPSVNLVSNTKDASQTMKDLENAVKVYNQILARETESGDKIITNKEMKYDLVKENFAVISQDIGQLNTDSKKKDEQNFQPMIYVGSIPAKNLIYMGFIIGSLDNPFIAKKESFEKTFDQLATSEVTDNKKFTNQFDINFDNLAPLLITSRGIKDQTKEQFLKEAKAKMQNSLVERNSYMILEFLLNLKDLNIIHNVIDPSTSEVKMELTWNKSPEIPLDEKIETPKVETGSSGLDNEVPNPKNPNLK